MKSLRYISENAKKGDLLLIEAAGNNGSVLLCEYDWSRLHQSKWNNIYEHNWRKGGDFGYIAVAGNPLQIGFREHKTYSKDSFAFGFPSGLDDSCFGVSGFSLGVDSVVKRLCDIGFDLYAMVIEKGGLVTSRNASEAPRKWGFMKKKSPLLFKPDVVEKIFT